jgi:hypothetical protein
LKYQIASNSLEHLNFHRTNDHLKKESEWRFSYSSVPVSRIHSVLGFRRGQPNVCQTPQVCRSPHVCNSRCICKSPRIFKAPEIRIRKLPYIAKEALVRDAGYIHSFS